MKEKITAIVLGTVKHSDRHNVTSVYTREQGRLALLTPAGSTRAARQNAARLQPLSVFEAQVNISTTRELQLPTAITPVRIWRSIYYDPIKSTIVMFLSEFLNRLLREAHAEPSLWDYITDSIEFFDTLTKDSGMANFHISFMVGMTHLMGIHPDLGAYTAGTEFDMNAGKMVVPYLLQSKGGIRIDESRSAFIPKLARMNYANAGAFRFSGKERGEIVEGLLKYFGCHFPGCDHLKSLDVLKEIFI